MAALLSRDYTDPKIFRGRYYEAGMDAPIHPPDPNGPTGRASLAEKDDPGRPVLGPI